MAWVLAAIVIGLIGVAIAVQVYYLVGLKRAGVGITRATMVVFVFNIALLSLLGLGLLALVLIGTMTVSGL